MISMEAAYSLQWGRIVKGEPLGSVRTTGGICSKIPLDHWGTRCG